MKIDLVPATVHDAPALARLWQLYVHDFSEHLGLDVGDDGLFPVGNALSRCGTDPRTHGYCFRVDGRLAGFAILEERSRLTGDAGVMDVAEFFVMRKYRRRGVGAAGATLAFDLFPRRWEVRQQPSNVAATAFWRRVIHDYTGGRFREIFVDDARFRGPVQSFELGA